MPGDTQFNRQVKVNARKVQLQRFRQTYNSVVPNTTGTSTVQLFASTGYLARVILLGVYMPAPTGAASGTHKCEITIGTDRTYGAEEIYYNAAAFNAAITKTVATTDTLYKGLVFSATVPLQIMYSNVTNVDTGAGDTRLIYVLYEEEAISS